MIAATPALLLGWLAVLVACGVAGVAGRGPARKATLFIAMGSMLAGAAHLLAPAGWVEALSGLVNLGVLVALASLAWKPRALWPLVLVGLQGLIVALDALRAVEPDLRPSTFMIATSLVTAALLATLLRAALGSRRRAHLSS